MHHKVSPNSNIQFPTFIPTVMLQWEIQKIKKEEDVQIAKKA